MRMVGSLVLVLVLFLVMDRPLLGNEWHECLGVALLVFILLHVSYKQGWFVNLYRGRQSAQRVLGTVANLLLGVMIVTTIISGLLISTTIFPVLQLRGAAAIFVRELHQGSAYGSFILMGIHFGLQWNSLFLHLKKRLDISLEKRCYTVVGYIVAVVLSLYGIYASFVQHLRNRLMMEHMIDIGGSSTPLQYSFDFAMIFFGYAAVAWGAKKLVSR